MTRSKSTGIPAASFFSGRSFHQERQAIETIHHPECTCLDGGCSNPHPQRVNGGIVKTLPIIPIGYARPVSAIDEAFAKARENIAQLEAKRLEPTTSIDWSPGQHCRRAS
jgi:hypothetical protein